MISNIHMYVDLLIDIRFTNASTAQFISNRLKLYLAGRHHHTTTLRRPCGGGRRTIDWFSQSAKGRRDIKIGSTVLSVDGQARILLHRRFCLVQQTIFFIGTGSHPIDQYADIDFQSIACAVADEILKAVRVSGYVPG